MQLLEDIYRNYPTTRADGRTISSARVTPDVVAIQDGLPALFRELVSEIAPTQDVEIYRSLGKGNYAQVPWVAVCRTDVTRKVTAGFYVVLLFHAEMNGCFLSLNQGYTQFQRAFPTKDLALYQVEASARRCLDFLEVRGGTIVGRIDLGASGNLAPGYERGAILSEWYPRYPALSEARLHNDLSYLMDQYDRLATFAGPDLLLGLPPASESAFQDAVAKLASSKDEWQGPPPGPVPVPAPVPGSNSTRYTRDARVCGRALKLADFRCEADRSHLTFISRKSRENFVESHHLVPMSLQGRFSVSLDVVENVVALCPTCHRMLHHGRRGPKGPILRKLFKSREAGLREREILISVDRLIDAYSHELENED